MIPFLGIDPGKGGGLAVVDGAAPPRAWPMPETERDLYDLVRGLRDVRRAVIERVAATPQMGVVSAFTFGRGYGALRLALVAAGIPFEEVAPGVWQKAMGCLSKGDKNITKARAQQLFPEVAGGVVRITHAVADALLIAEWARRRG